jgi:hypothetical protein
LHTMGLERLFTVTNTRLFESESISCLRIFTKIVTSDSHATVPVNVLRTIIYISAAEDTKRYILINQTKWNHRNIKSKLVVKLTFEIHIIPHNGVKQ